MDARLRPLPSLKLGLARKASGPKDLVSPYLSRTRPRRREPKRSVENFQPGSGLVYRDSSISCISQSIGSVDAPLSRSRNASKHQFFEKVDVEDLLSSTYRSQAQLRKTTSFYSKLRIDPQGCFRQAENEASRPTLPAKLGSLASARKPPRKTVRKLNVRLTDLARKHRKRL